MVNIYHTVMDDDLYTVADEKGIDEFSMTEDKDV